MNDSALIKIGGSLAVDEKKLADFAHGMANLWKKGLKLVLVHGGGKEINENLSLLKEEVKFINGLRVTDVSVLNMVEMTLSAQVNKKLVRLLQNEGVPAVGVSGVDGALIKAQKKEAEVDLGFVGQPQKVDPKLVETLWEGGFLPVVSPIASDGALQAFNVNADHSAAAVAQALQVKRLVFVSDVPGVMEDGVVLPELNDEKVASLIDKEVISGGMIPKVESCLESLEKGIQEVHIVGWHSEESFSDQLQGKENHGTILS